MSDEFYGFDDEDFALCEENAYDPGEDCGRWRNGALGPYYWCLSAGTEFCDFECPYNSPNAQAQL
jgi:hypothetical protein